ncbi:MAG TPA: PDZ domain-containing protein [Firmicutes bacterium]|nr:PDZ domain-containing protein [Bacillota bacterium]
MNPQLERAYSIINDMTGDGLVTNADRDLFQRETGIDLRECLFVIYVYDDSPGEDVDLREGDILMEFNGVPVKNITQLLNELDKYRIGDLVTIEWMRRDYAVWDSYIGEFVIEYSGQRADEKEKS